MTPSVAVLIPCFNEQATIEEVVMGFQKTLPGSRICVFDNNSTDQTIQKARDAGAEVWSEKRQGKGNVVRRMFAEIEADFYVMVDGDATYDAASAPRMLQLIQDEKLDMLVARRVSTEEEAYRSGHEFGNRLLSGAVGWIFGSQLSDILSGYRVFSKRFVKSFPAMTGGFEIETELSVHALQLRLPVDEVPTPYFARPAGSASKLHTWADGFRILATIFRLFVLEKPFQFFLLLSFLFFLTASALFIPVLAEYFSTGLVSRFPSLIVAVGGYVMALTSLIMGTLLYSNATGRLEAKRLKYLEIELFDGG